MTHYLAGAILVAGLLFPAAVSADDRHAGYYYPEPGSEETYRARARTLPNSDRDRRLGFVVGFMGDLAKDPAPQRFAVFAKGGEAEKLIIVALDDEAFATLFRARAVLALLTSRVRASPLFAELGVQNLFTFYDLAKLLGFDQITISDGRAWSHRVWIQ
tara:strand:- start:2638 stop:3114 length:477 start_codon:yes stop_codon:yes gene_type:complete